MKQSRKDALTRYIPHLPEKAAEQMKGKTACNFAVMLNSPLDDTLYIRCYHRYRGGALAERQRYIFAKDGALRLTTRDDIHFTVAKEFREPVFCKSCYGYSFDNSYTVLNWQTLERSCLKYSCAEQLQVDLLMEYLKLYCKHPNVEYLLKSGYGHLLCTDYVGYWGTQRRLRTDSNINWKSNDLLKMLGLTRTEFRLLQGHEGYYNKYLVWRKLYPKYPPEILLQMARIFSSDTTSLPKFCRCTGLTPRRLTAYLFDQAVNYWDYRDYLEQCEKLHYDLHDTAIAMPHDFAAMHRRCSEIIRYEQTEQHRKLFSAAMADRRKLDFAYGDLLIRQPKSMDEIITEGATLNHCVGGYAERHAEGKLHILFIRTAEKPDVPFYTMELSADGKIRQVRGRKNADPTPAVQALVDAYTAYLQGIFNDKKKARKTA